MAQHKQDWSDIEPMQPATGGDRLAELLKASDEDMKNYPLLRSDFIAESLKRIDKLVGDCDGNPDADARLRWARTRREICTWLKQESLLDPEDSPACGYHKTLRDLLEGMLATKLANSTPESRYSTNPPLAAWCAFDLFVNVLAALMENERFKVIESLLSLSYLYDGSLYSIIYFWAGEALHKEEPGDLAKFVFQDPAVHYYRLIEAEMLAMLHCASTFDAQMRNRQIWLPRLFSGELHLKLDFFVRSTDRKAGMRNALACIGWPGTQESYANLEARASGYVKAFPHWEDYRSHNLLKTLGFCKAKNDQR